MEEFDVIENYLRHGDYPIGITKDQTCEENVEITTSSTKASCITRRKPTLHLCCMIVPSMAVFHMSFRCRLRTSTDWPSRIRRSWIHGDRAASPAADCRFALFLYICTAHVCNQNGK